MSAFSTIIKTTTDTNNDEMDKPIKKKSKKSLPSSLITIFETPDGERAGAPIDLPLLTNAKQIEQLVNTLLNNDEALPYAMYVNGIEIQSSVEDTLLLSLDDNNNNKLSLDTISEDTLKIVYQPLSVFRVRPVTRCVESMPGHTEAILHISYSPDGSCLASGGGDMTVRFWNVQTSMPMYTCTGHRHHVLCTTWAPNGLAFASSDKSGEIRIWDPKTGKPKLSTPLRGHTKWVTFLCFEPLHSDPTCRRLASSSKDNSIKIWNVHSGRLETTISGHVDSVECIKWGGTGLLYTASRDRTIKVWAIDGHGYSQQKLVRTLSGHAHRINSLAMNCDYVLRTGAHQLGIKDKSMKVSRNNTIIAAQPNDNPDTLKAREELKNIALERYTSVVGNTGNGEKLVSGSDDFTLIIWSPQDNKNPLMRLTGHQQLINHIAFSPDGRYFASASFDKKVKIWCGLTGRFLNTLTGHVQSVYQVTWSADSKFIVSASKDSTLKIWNVKDPKKAMNTLSGHMDEIYALDWSPDGTQCASGSKDRMIKIWKH